MLLSCFPCRHPRGKKRPLEQMHVSPTVECLIKQVTTGQNSMTSAAECARSAVSEGANSEALNCFASLGCDGKYEGNLERDFHNWLHRLYGIELDLYYIKLNLTVPSHKTADASYLFE